MYSLKAICIAYVKKHYDESGRTKQLYFSNLFKVITLLNPVYEPGFEVRLGFGSTADSIPIDQSQYVKGHHHVT